MKPAPAPTIRRRLSLWLMVVISLNLVILGGLMILLVYKVLFDQIDHHLHTVLPEAARIVSDYPSGERNRLLQQFVTQNGMAIVLINGQGTIDTAVYSSDVVPVTAEQSQRIQAIHHNPVHQDHFIVDPYRFVTVSVVWGPNQGILAVGQSLQTVKSTFINLAFVVVAGVIFSLVTTVGVVRQLLQRYLKPLEQVAAKADQIMDTKDLTLRLPARQETHELTLLTTAFNQMIGRIDAMFKREHQFFSDAAHTLKTPLAVIRSQIETNPHLKVRAKLGMITALDEGVHTIQDLLLVTRLETSAADALEPVDLSALARESGTILEALAREKQIQVHTEIDSRLTVLANQPLLTKALANLIHNAITYTPDRGSIVFQAKARRNQVFVTLKDTGMGIPAKNLPQLFRRFYRGDNVGTIKGSGLGLAIAKAAVETCGGTISLSSRLSQGTTVTVKLPLFQA